MATAQRSGPRRALVFGGSGAVGGEVVRALSAAGAEVHFTYHRGEARARSLASELGQRAHAIDLRDASAIASLVRALDEEGAAPDLFIHAAAVSRSAPLAALTDEDWDEAHAVNCRAAFLACRALAPLLARAGGGDVVLVGSVQGNQSLPLPVAFAATQGTLATLAMALAKELGSAGTRVNLVALGLLDEGISRTLDDKRVAEYRQFSAFGRLGTAREAARAIVWLALENSYMSGKVLSANGGI